MESQNYAGREQAFSKHWILKQYLQKLAFKVAHFRRGTTLNYVDGFSGPWDAVAHDASDSSPCIAAKELRGARETLAALPSPIAFTPRAMFVEANAISFGRLEKLRLTLGIETEAHHGCFEDHIDRAVAFARVGRHPFAFVFIDPTGWTGYGLRRITPLLRVEPGEVLINFMTKNIMRFVDDGPANIAESFVELFGGDFRDRWRNQSGSDREDAIVRAYCDCVKRAGAFRHVVSTVVLNPQSDRTHYHLIYGTRSDEGLVTFRETEAGAIKLQRELRASVRGAARNERSGFAGTLFEPVVTDTNYVGSLLERYQGRATANLQADLMAHGSVLYDDAVRDALQWPMTKEGDVRGWIKQWQAEGSLAVEGLTGRQRVPKRKQGHRLRWLR